MTDVWLLYGRDEAREREQDLSWVCRETKAHPAIYIGVPNGEFAVVLHCPPGTKIMESIWSRRISASRAMEIRGLSERAYEARSTIWERLSGVIDPVDVGPCHHRAPDGTPESEER